MGPLTLSVMVNDPAISLPDACSKRKQNLLLKNSFASVSMGDEKPFDFLRTLFGTYKIFFGVVPSEEIVSVLMEFAEGVIAGATAGVVVETALYPIDTIKTRLQACCNDKFFHEDIWMESSLHLKVRLCFTWSSKQCAESTSPEDSLYEFCNFLLFGSGLPNPFIIWYKVLYLKLVSVADKAARGGEKLILRGLYSGLAGNLAGVLPASALFVGVYEPIKQKLLRIFPENLSAFSHLTCVKSMNFGHWSSEASGISLTCIGVDALSILSCFCSWHPILCAIGGIAASLIRVPTEVIKQRMQTGQFTSASGAVRFIASKEGFKGFYAGYGSFLLRDLPFDAIQFCIYEQIRIGYMLAARRNLNDPENAIIGAFAGAVTGAITTPLDVIKTRLMVQGSANQYLGIFDCVQTIIKEEGPRAFLKGIGPRVLWIGIGGSIFFGVLESTKRFLAERRPTVSQHTYSDKIKDK
ncbi:unnamed protein product [Sphenostylis stenocarpa]|uniref:Uncharacterized protein n=1 Tax=Sphenostylis stenocarpa TaxID=92480 RepID=A0AA86V6X1_9FABA|nr:unnamed protein product [Sphenostylis stenocarpa]